MTKGPILYAFILPGMAAFLVSRSERSPRLDLERLVDVALAAAHSLHWLVDRLLDEPGVLQRCRDQGVHEPLRSKP